MKTEHTIDQPARAGRATKIAAMVITGLVAFIWGVLRKAVSNSRSRRMEDRQSAAGIPALYHPSDWRDPHPGRREPSDSQCASID